MDGESVIVHEFLFPVISENDSQRDVARFIDQLIPGLVESTYRTVMRMHYGGVIVDASRLRDSITVVSERRQSPEGPAIWVKITFKPNGATA